MPNVAYRLALPMPSSATRSLTEVASYGSVFGQLATFFVTLGYVYYACVAFLGGLQVDAVIRARVDAMADVDC